MDKTNVLNISFIRYRKADLPTPPGVVQLCKRILHDFFSELFMDLRILRSACVVNSDFNIFPGAFF